MTSLIDSCAESHHFYRPQAVTLHKKIMQLFFLIIWWIYFFIFYSGYPLLYVLLYLFAGNKNLKRLVTEKLSPLLPVTYAFVSTIFWIFILMSGRMYSVIQRIATLTPGGLILIYSLSTLLFWLSRFRQKRYISFLHSLPLFLAPFLYMLVNTFRHKVLPDNYAISLLGIYATGFIFYVIALTFLYAITVIIKNSRLKRYKNVLN